jgi:hypothetical protein
MNSRRRISDPSRPTHHQPIGVEVAWGPREACDKAKLDRVVANAENDRDRRGRTFGRDRSGCIAAGGNATGTIILPWSWSPRLALLHELVPKAVRVAVLFNPAVASNEPILREAEKAARASRANHCARS